MGEHIQRGLFRSVAAALFAAIIALVFIVSDPVQAGSTLFVVPIALLALADGVRGGVIGALVATALVLVWVLTDDVGLTVLGWGSRLVSFAVVGLLVGRFEDLARAYERRRLDERYAEELHDQVIQSLVVASYQLRDDREAKVAVDRALAGAKEIISRRLADVEPGDLRLGDR